MAPDLPAGLESSGTRLYVALVHYPVLNRNSERIASAVTTLDINDIARLAKTYGLKKFFVVTPLTDQQRLAERVIRHWTDGFGAAYNRDRRTAMELAAVLPTVEDAVEAVTLKEGERPVLIATDASRREPKGLSYDAARGLLQEARATLLLFGTAWGLDGEVLEAADYVLDPVYGEGDYNHLSVRAAAAVILDRLVGR